MYMSTCRMGKHIYIYIYKHLELCRSTIKEILEHYKAYTYAWNIYGQHVELIWKQSGISITHNKQLYTYIQTHKPCMDNI